MTRSQNLALRERTLIARSVTATKTEQTSACREPRKLYETAEVGHTYFAFRKVAEKGPVFMCCSFSAHLVSDAAIEGELEWCPI